MKIYTLTYMTGREVKGLTISAPTEDEARRRGLLLAKHRNGDTPTEYTLRKRRG